MAALDGTALALPVHLPGRAVTRARERGFDDPAAVVVEEFADVAPVGAGEFTCHECFLVLSVAVARPDVPGVCLDCA